MKSCFHKVFLFPIARTPKQKGEVPSETPREKIKITPLNPNTVANWRQLNNNRTFVSFGKRWEFVMPPEHLENISYLDTKEATILSSGAQRLILLRAVRLDAKRTKPEEYTKIVQAVQREIMTKIPNVYERVARNPNTPTQQLRDLYEIFKNPVNDLLENKEYTEELRLAIVCNWGMTDKDLLDIALFGEAVSPRYGAGEHLIARYALQIKEAVEGRSKKSLRAISPPLHELFSRFSTGSDYQYFAAVGEVIVGGRRDFGFKVWLDKQYLPLPQQSPLEGNQNAKMEIVLHQAIVHAEQAIHRSLQYLKEDIKDKDAYGITGDIMGLDLQIQDYKAAYAKKLEYLKKGQDKKRTDAFERELKMNVNRVIDEVIAVCRAHRNDIPMRNRITLDRIADARIK